MSSPTQAAMLLGFQPPGTTLSYRNTYTSTTDLTTYTFAASDLGTAGENRRVVVVATASGANNTTLSSATINGVSATVIASANNATCTAYLLIATVPTGATGDVVITWSAGKGRCAISVYAIYDVAPTAFDTDSGTAQNNTVSMNCPPGGVIIAGGNLATTGTTTWGGITEDVDQTFETTQHTAASQTFSVNQSGLSVSCNWSASNTQACVFASFGPY